MEYKINTILPIQFEKIENPPYLNDSRFQAVRCYVAHEKENYNGSYFDLSVLDNMAKNMAGIPIVGYISANNINEKDFNGHEQKLTIDKDGVSIEYLGRAYGCIISNDDVTFVDRMHEDGKMRKYLCVTGVLWKMFTDSIDIFDRDISKNHSMELQEDSIEGSFEKDGYYHFTEAKVRALCILGEDVMPAMSNSIIEKFSQSDIDSTIQELLKEVNESIKQFNLQNQSSAPEVDNINFSKKEDKELDEKLELLKKYDLTVESILFSIEELSLEEIESKIKDQFALLASQKQEEISNALRVEKYIDRWGDEYSKYSYVDHDDVEAFAYDRQDNWNLYGFTYSTNGDSIVVDFSTKKKKKFKIVDFEDGISTEFELLPKEAVEYEISSKEKELTEQFSTEKEAALNEIQIKLDSITSEYESIKPEVERLQNFEKETLETARNEAEKALFELFPKLSGNKEFENLKKQSHELTLEQLEKEISHIVVKTSDEFKSYSQKREQNPIVKVKNFKRESSDDNPYGDLFDKVKKG